MKLIAILFLISFNCFAQFKVEVQNLSGQVTHESEFKTLFEAETWVKEQSEQGSWGKNERLVPLDGATEEERALAVEVIPANEEAGQPSMLKLKKTYSFKISDVTAEKQAEESAKQAALQEKQAAKDRLKNFNWDNLATPHKQVLKDLYDSIK